jgi:hypothetical protein
MRRNDVDGDMVDSVDDETRWSTDRRLRTWKHSRTRQNS